MLGYTASTNEIYVFLKDSEIERLERKGLSGKLVDFTNLQIIGDLDVSVNGIVDRDAKSIEIRNPAYQLVLLRIIMRRGVLETLETKRRLDIQDGNYRFLLRDFANLKPLEKSFFEKSQEYLDRYSGRT